MMRERNRIADAMDDIRQVESEAQDAVDLWDMAEIEGDAAMFVEVEQSIRAAVEKAKTAELKALLSGEVDGNDCYIEINAGAGGTESQDWAAMLRRMYVRWANSRGFKLEELDEHAGDTAGIKSATRLYSRRVRPPAGR
jgi:peptide chain release factor 2